MNEWCRWLNQYLGVLVLAAVLWRGLPMVMSLTHSWVELHRRLCFLVIVLYGLATSWGSIHYVRLGAPASPASTIVSAASILIIGLCIVWPHPTHYSAEAPL